MPTVCLVASETDDVEEQACAMHSPQLLCCADAPGRFERDDRGCQPGRVCAAGGRGAAASERALGGRRQQNSRHQGRRSDAGAACASRRQQSQTQWPKASAHRQVSHMCLRSTLRVLTSRCSKVHLRNLVRHVQPQTWRQKASAHRQLPHICSCQMTHLISLALAGTGVTLLFLPIRAQTHPSCKSTWHGPPQEPCCACPGL